MAKKMRVGVIGSGMMGREHIANLLLIPEAEITALVDPANSSLDWARTALPGDAQISTFRTSDELAQANCVDVVFVVSPNHTHADVLKPFWGRDVHILCEKPLCHTVDDARSAVEHADSHPGVFWVGMEYRFMPPAATFIERVHGGAVGRLQMLSIREHRFPFLVKVGDWNRFSANTGGTMVEKCCHFFDLMRHIVGAEAVRVYCSGAMDVNHQDERYDGRKPDIIDNSFTVVDFDNGVRAMLDLCMFADGATHQEEIAATGDKARLEVLIPPGELVLSPRVGFMQPKQVTREIIPVDPDAMRAGSHFGATYFQQRAFFDAIASGAPPQVSAQDGLMAVAIGAAAELSAREKRAVEMREVL